MTIPYGRQEIDADDIAAVVAVLEGDWLTTGPSVEGFEDDFAAYVGADHAIAVSNGTAALHLSMLAADIGPGDEVIVSALTFAASANCARYVGADVVFADVNLDTLTIDPGHVERLITDRTRAVVAVDYAGTPCDLDELRELCRSHDLVLVEDACHAPGATYKGQWVGSIADLSIFSFHPVKHLTTGEGGMVTTNDATLAARLRRLRTHGIDAGWRSRASSGTWEYDMVELGFNYRLPDLNCALGRSQLRKQPTWIARRRELVANYHRNFEQLTGLVLPQCPDDREGAWHLYPVRFEGDGAATVREQAFKRLRSRGIGVNVHYRPVYLNTYYRELGYRPGLCPNAETAYAGLLSLPLWHGLTDADQRTVIDVFLNETGDLLP